MIEWTKKVPKIGTKKIKRSFCFLPTRCEENKMVWLDWVYIFYSFHYASSRSSDDPDGFWWDEAVLSTSQFREYIDNIALHLIDNNPEIRQYAEAAKRFIKRK